MYTYTGSHIFNATMAPLLSIAYSNVSFSKVDLALSQCTPVLYCREARGGGDCLFKAALGVAEHVGAVEAKEAGHKWLRLHAVRLFREALASRDESVVNQAGSIRGDLEQAWDEFENVAMNRPLMPESEIYCDRQKILRTAGGRDEVYGYMDLMARSCADGGIWGDA